jgi:NAD(P)-dependent dehydrogenase (short-subunit alcohol dehydrogenase family)
MDYITLRRRKHRKRAGQGSVAVAERERIGQLKEKVALVTGGTGGIGKEIARGLAQVCGKLIIVGWDAEKGAQAEKEILASSKDCDVRFFRADLSLVWEARRVSEEVLSHCSALHYLVHSAGFVRGRRVVTAEALESNFATNYLSRFALTGRLLPTHQAAGRPGESARVLFVSHPGFDGKIHYDDVNLTTNFSTIRAFRQFHFANDVFAVELARRLSAPAGRPPVTVSCLHPGPTKTDIDRDMPLWMKLMVRAVIHPMVSNAPSVPAATALKLLLADEYEGDSGALFSLGRQIQARTCGAERKEPGGRRAAVDLQRGTGSLGVGSAHPFG